MIKMDNTQIQALEIYKEACATHSAIVKDRGWAGDYKDEASEVEALCFCLWQDKKLPVKNYPFPSGFESPRAFLKFVEELEDASNEWQNWAEYQKQMETSK
jgi:hypothetical protein